MANSLAYSVGVVVLVVASMLVVAENADPVTDPCAKVTITNDQESCIRCVQTIADSKTNLNCTFEENQGGESCKSKPDVGEGIGLFRNVSECVNSLPTTPAPSTTTTTPTTTAPSTTAPPTTAPPTNATTLPPTTPTTTATSTTTTSTTTPPSTTTTVTPTTTTPSNSSTSTTTVGPTTATPTPAPRSGGGMSFASFFGGIVFTLCCSGLGYLIWRFYRARVDQNYHTLSTNLI